ncbi:hypothetical protein SK128_004041, partial [Halocaridina rubra]
MKTLALVLALVGSTWGQTRPCVEVDQQLSLPCQCTVSSQNEISINCDNVAFTKDFPLLPF